MPRPRPDQDFTALLAEHGPRLRKVTMTYGRSREDREDLHQDILAQLWRSFRSYDPSRPFATWMYRIALNVAISHVRRVARDRDRVAADGDLDPPAPVAESDADDRGSILQRLIGRLDEFDRALLLLQLEERTYAEIADVLGLTESNVGTRLHRLRQRLKTLAAAESGPETER